MLLVLVIIAVLVAAILFGQLLSSRLFWLIVFGLMVASWIGGGAHAENSIPFPVPPNGNPTCADWANSRFPDAQKGFVQGAARICDKSVRFGYAEEMMFWPLLTQARAEYCVNITNKYMETMPDYKYLFYVSIGDCAAEMYSMMTNNGED